MNTIKKTIFLSNKENLKKQSFGVVTLENKQNGIFGTFKTYETLSPNLILGIKAGDNIIKQNVTLTNNSFNFLLRDKVSLEDTISCVILDSQGSTLEPLLWGSEKSQNYKAQIISSLNESMAKIKTNKATLDNSKVLKENKSNSFEEYEYNKSIKNIEPFKDDDLVAYTPIKASANTKSINENIIKFPNTKFHTKIDDAKDNFLHSTENRSQNISQKNVTTNNSTTIPNTKFHTKLNDVDESENLFFGSNESQDNFEFNTIKLDEFKNRFHINIDDNQNEISFKPYMQNTINKSQSHNQNDEEIAIAGNASSLFESDEKEINDLIDKELNNTKFGAHKFYDMISEQIDELFDKYPRERNLENLIPDSKWCKINYDDVTKHYVVGIILKDNDIKYVCYGVPGNYMQEPPIELKEYSQWLPTDITDPYTQGYWVMYQDADTGENVIVN